ncbi:MAG: hypothetical protein MUC51_01065 [Anaerolineae bacterium]|jgi:hypothetical protein|nr:hypothetical protein [Anaerolineae bacterium]
MNTLRAIHSAFERSEGILRLAPNWVPRLSNTPGRRLRLHPDDYFTLGMQRGAIKERWFCSSVHANGAAAPADEGMSYVALSDRQEDKRLFRDVVDELGPALIGDELYRRHGTWPMFSKFYDYDGRLAFHIHPDDAASAQVGMLGKPEAYYFPFQLNDHLGQFPVTYFGFDPDVTREQVKERLLQFESADNRITELSRGYRIQLGTGWYTPPGVVHAPGSVLTYEPQCNSDIGSAQENVVNGVVVPYRSLVSSCPDDKKHDIDYIMSLMDWERNVDPHYRRRYFRPSIPCPTVDDRYREQWITYGNDHFGAKELTVLPGQSVVVKDRVAFGCILIQGHGQFGVHDAEAAIMLRYGQMSADEYFVSEAAAQAGIPITNHSRWEPMVLLKHFAANHPHMPPAPSDD